MSEVRLKDYQKVELKGQRNIVVRAVWYLVNALFFMSTWMVFNSFKVILLKLFGAKVGKGVIIKPLVNIKYPWMLDIGNHVWIGEGVWIDNLTKVTLGDNVCLSQSSFLLTGNHDYKAPTFDLIVGKIRVDNGAWIGAKSVICPGVNIGSHVVLTVGSIATKDLEAFGVYQGNPARKVRTRTIT